MRLSGFLNSFNKQPISSWFLTRSVTRVSLLKEKHATTIDPIMIMRAEKPHNKLPLIVCDIFHIIWNLDREENLSRPPTININKNSRIYIFFLFPEDLTYRYEPSLTQTISSYNGNRPLSHSSQIYLPSGGVIFKHSTWKLEGQVSQQINDPPIEQIKHQEAFTWCISFAFEVFLLIVVSSDCSTFADIRCLGQMIW